MKIFLITYAVVTAIVTMLWVFVWFYARWTDVTSNSPTSWLPDLTGGTLAIAAIWPVIVGYLVWRRITDSKFPWSNT